MKTLLDKARAYEPVKTGRLHNATEEMAQLAVAWASGKIRTSQVQSALGTDNEARGTIYSALATGLKHAFRLGLLAEKNGHK